MLADEAADDRTWGGNIGTMMYIDRRVLAIARKQYSSSFSPHDSILALLSHSVLGLSIQDTQAHSGLENFTLLALFLLGLGAADGSPG